MKKKTVFKAGDIVIARDDSHLSVWRLRYRAESSRDSWIGEYMPIRIDGSTDKNAGKVCAHLYENWIKLKRPMCIFS